jgi:hypothetical protein
MGGQIMTPLERKRLENLELAMAKLQQHLGILLITTITEQELINLGVDLQAPPQEDDIHGSL